MRFLGTSCALFICGVLGISLQSHANDSDFAKYENTISMTCFPDSGEITQWWIVFYGWSPLRKGIAAAYAVRVRN